MAGGGVKGGQVIGATDEFGVRAAGRSRVDAHDVNATILRLLGLDHTKLTYLYQGRDHAPDRRARRTRIHQAVDRLGEDILTIFLRLLRTVRVCSAHS